MYVDEVLCHGENGGATWQTSHRGCIMRKVVSKEITAGGRFDFFLDSVEKAGELINLESSGGSRRTSDRGSTFKFLGVVGVVGVVSMKVGFMR